MKNGVYQILHVEDNKNQLHTCEQTLKGALGNACSIIGASTMDDARSRILALHKELDLIILDIDLGTRGDENGLDLLKDIRGINQTIPIFILSTHVNDLKDNLRKMKNQQIIRGYSEPLNQPWADEIKSILEGSSVNILHLSDIHEGKFFAYDKTVLKKDDLLRELCLKVGHVDFVVVSGDLSSINAEEDYYKANDLLAKIKLLLNLSNGQFIFAPGNHDWDWNCADTRLFSRYLRFINKFYSSDLSEDCILDYPKTELEDDYTSQRSIYNNLISVCAYPAQKTVVLSMNSVNLRGKHDNFLEKKCFAAENPDVSCGLLSGGEISSEQIQNAKNKLSQLFKNHPEAEKYARIATFHHNIFEPSHIEQFDWCPNILNEGNLMRFLTDYGFRFVLHGHLHHAENYIYCVGNNNPGISVISTGTLSAKDRTLSSSFCANKISFLVDGQGNISETKLTKFSLPNDDFQWKAEEFPIHFIEVG